MLLVSELGQHAWQALFPPVLPSCVFDRLTGGQSVTHIFIRRVCAFKQTLSTHREVSKKATLCSESSSSSAAKFH